MSDNATRDQSAPASGLGGKYLTFGLGHEEYGLEVMKVREIIGYVEITAVPRTPPHVSGVINLRGQVIAVIDLRAKFGMPPAERTDATCIIVVEIFRGGRKLRAGLVVDRVCEVLNIPSDRIEEAPSLGASLDTGLILGLGKVGETVKILLDVDGVILTGGSMKPAEAA